MTRNNVARARYHAVVTRWSKRMSHGYALDVSHTWSDTKDNQTGEGNGFSSAGERAGQLRQRRAGIRTSLQDLKHRLNVNVTFQLPFGEGRKLLASGVGNALAGGWDYYAGGPVSAGIPPEYLAVEQQLQPVQLELLLDCEIFRGNPV